MRSSCSVTIDLLAIWKVLPLLNSKPRIFYCGNKYVFMITMWSTVESFGIFSDFCIALFCILSLIMGKAWHKITYIFLIIQLHIFLKIILLVKYWYVYNYVNKKYYYCFQPITWRFPYQCLVEDIYLLKKDTIMHVIPKKNSSKFPRNRASVTSFGNGQLLW